MALTAAQLEANRLFALGELKGDAYIKAYFGGAADPTKYSDAVQQKYGIGNYTTLAELAASTNTPLSWDASTKNVTLNNNTYTPAELKDAGGTLSSGLDRWILPNDTVASLLGPVASQPVASKPYNPPVWAPEKLAAPVEPVRTTNFYQATPVTPATPTPVTPAPVLPATPAEVINTDVIRGGGPTPKTIVPTQMGDLKIDGGIDPNRINLNNLFKHAEDSEDPNNPQRNRIKDAGAVNKLDTLPKRSRRRGELASLLKPGSGLMTGG